MVAYWCGWFSIFTKTNTVTPNVTGITLSTLQGYHFFKLSLNSFVLLFPSQFELLERRLSLLDKAPWSGPSQPVEASSDTPPEPWTPRSPPAPAASSCWTGKSAASSPTPRPCASACSHDRMYGRSVRSRCFFPSHHRWSCCLPWWCCRCYTGTCYPHVSCECRRRWSQWSCWRSRQRHCLFAWTAPGTVDGSDCLRPKPIFPPNDEDSAGPRTGASLHRPGGLRGSLAPSRGERRHMQQETFCLCLEVVSRAAVLNGECGWWSGLAAFIVVSETSSVTILKIPEVRVPSASVYSVIVTLKWLDCVWLLIVYSGVVMFVMLWVHCLLSSLLLLELISAEIGICDGTPLDEWTADYNLNALRMQVAHICFLTSFYYTYLRVSEGLRNSFDRHIATKVFVSCHCGTLRWIKL